jgi:hypothetical protein
MSVKINGVDFVEWMVAFEQQRNHVLGVIAETLDMNIEEVKNGSDNLAHIAHLYREGKISEEEFDALVAKEMGEEE